jgi:hypothetical protein
VLLRFSALVGREQGNDMNVTILRCAATGTLTTEHLTLRGVVVSSSSSETNATADSSGWALVPTQRAPTTATQILATCQSLVEVSVWV